MNFAAPGVLLDYYNAVTIPVVATEGLFGVFFLLFFMFIVWNGASVFEWIIEKLYWLVDNLH